MKRIQFFLLFTTIILFPKTLLGHDFSGKLKDGTILFYNITDSTKNTVEVTFEGLYNRPVESSLSGKIQIPAVVVHNKKNYTVTSIGPSAFNGLEKITSIELPFSIAKIGEYAFAGCSSLQVIVFPSRQVKIEETAFWKCSSLSDISFGKNWSFLDFKIFRWTEGVEKILIPAGVTKIRGLRYLKNLQMIEVNEENNNYSSVDGMLFSKDKKTIYYCPSAREGKVAVPEGVVSILKGAFDQCNAITEIDLPSTFETIEYSEFFGMMALERVLIRTMKPFITAICDGKDVFALKLASNVDVFVPKDAIDDYKKLLSSEAGVYTTLDGKEKKVCTKAEMLQFSKLKKLK